MSLRSRLSVLMIVVALVALAAANIAVYTMVSRFLEQRLDGQVQALTGPAIGLLRSPVEPQPGAGGGRPPGPFNASGAWVGIFDNAGRRVTGRYLLDDSTDRRAPAVSPARVSSAGDAAYIDTSARQGTGSIPYRARIARLPDGNVVVAALPATEVRDTKQRLVLIELAVTAAILLVTLGLAWWLTGVGLRPLRKIGDTAGRIARGDLSQRVEPSGTATEVGRLGLALNSMLDEIESAFSAREDSERKLRRFVADASHDLRTPLTSIRGYAELLGRDDALDRPGRATAARRIEEESVRLGKLVEDLLLLARLDEGEGLDRRAVDLAQLVGDLVTDARMLSGARPISLAAPDSLPVHGDGDRLARAVSNLLANALTHTPVATPVDVRVDVDGGQAVVCVADHGEGISPDLAGRVFDRFWRADPSRSKARGGSGLGLAITAAIAEAHGGRCEVVPTPGGGATFRLSIPAAAGLEPATAARDPGLGRAATAAGAPGLSSRIPVRAL